MKPKKQKLRALLVGINKYHPQSKDIDNLEACRNDVEAMRKLLLAQYSSLSPGIETLLDGDATRKQIIQSFRNYLIAPADAHTTILFYYSGHGSRQPLPKAFQPYVAGTSRYHRREETLVCYDSRAYVNNQWLEKDLADKELAILIEEAAQKKAHVVIILDCCHSGSGTRSNAPAPPPEFQKRAAEERLVQDALNRSYLDRYYEKMLKQEGEITLPNGRHILLAGTQKDSQSWETRIDGQRRGIFTYYLEQALWENPHLTYADLFSLVNPKVVSFTEKIYQHQNPQFEAYNFFNAHSHFLTGVASPADRRFYGVKMVRGAWQIEQGEVHGLALATTNPTLEWAIYEQPASPKPIAQVRTTEIRLDYNIIEVIEGHLAPDQNYLAELRSMPAQKWPIGIHLDAPVDELGSPLYQLVEDNTLKEQLVINQAQKAFTLTNTEGLSITDEYNPTVVISKLERVARWHQILKSHRPQPQVLHYEDFPLHFRVMGENAPQKSVLKRKNILELTSKKGQYFPVPADDSAEGMIDPWTIPYKIVGQNLSIHQVYFTLLYLDPWYGIEVYYNGLVPAQTNEIILAEGYGLTPDDRLNMTIDRFKFIVSTKPLISYLFTQPNLLKELAPSDIKRTGQQVPEDWLTKLLEVFTTKQDDD